MEYQKVPLQKHARLSARHNSESQYWRQFRHPVFVKEYAPVTSIHFAPSRPHRFAVTAATKVQIYAPRTQKVTKTISRFKDIARSAQIRQDGKLVIAGDDSGLIQVFDVNSRAILRSLDSHKQSVHVSKFSPSVTTQALSCSDDTTVKLWDVPSETPITTFTEHTDYVRSGLVSQSNPSIILTGSYDSTVRLFDARTGSCELLMASSARRTPVEQVLMFPSGTMAISSCGPIVCVWDLVAGGCCARALSNHQKTITSLTFNGSSTRLLTGALDQMVKVYDVSSYQVAHTMRYPAPVLSLALSPDDTHLAAGMSDGTLSVRRRVPKTVQEDSEPLLSSKALSSGAYESFLSGLAASIGDVRAPRSKEHSTQLGDPHELKAERRRKKRLPNYDRFLKDFKYAAALDAVLGKQIAPTIAYSVIQELVHRDGLRVALSARDDVLLEPVLRLLLRNITDPRFGRLSCGVGCVLLELYAPVFGQSPLIDRLLLQLKRKIQAELRFQSELTRLKGSLDMIFASTALTVQR